MTFDIQSTTEHLENEAGLVLAGQIARFSSPTSVVRDTHNPLNMALVSMFGLFVQGRSSFEEIEQFRSSLFFKNAFDLPFVPAQETTFTGQAYLSLFETDMFTHVLSADGEPVYRTGATEDRPFKLRLQAVECYILLESRNGVTAASLQTYTLGLSVTRAH